MQGFPFVGGVPFRVGDQVSKGMHGCLLLFLNIVNKSP
jgi:hypothetical protein